MSNNKQQTPVEWLIEQMPLGLRKTLSENGIDFEQAKEMEKEQMRLDIEKKWEQYRIITNNEDAWSFKEWLINQTYGGGNK